jgi:hypothetical protein
LADIGTPNFFASLEKIYLYCGHIYNSKTDICAYVRFL